MTRQALVFNRQLELLNVFYHFPDDFFRYSSGAIVTFNFPRPLRPLAFSELNSCSPVIAFDSADLLVQQLGNPVGIASYTRTIFITLHDRAEAIIRRQRGELLPAQVPWYDEKPEC